MKIFFSLVILAGLIYGAYVVNDKFLSRKPETSAAPPAPAAAEVQQMPAIVLANDVPAYDPADPSKRIGTFLKGTEVRTAPVPGAPGMKQVILTGPNGETLQALSKEEDLSKPAVPEAVRPLEKAKSLASTEEDGTLKSEANVKRTLGNKQTGMSRSCDSGPVKAMGGSEMKPLPEPVAPTNPSSQSPAENIKDRAKDLQQMEPGS